MTHIRGYTIFTFAAYLGYRKLLTLLSEQENYDIGAEWEHCKASKECMDGFKVRSEDLQSLMKQTVAGYDKRKLEEDMASLLSETHATAYRPSIRAAAPTAATAGESSAAASASAATAAAASSESTTPTAASAGATSNRPATQRNS